MRSAYEKPKKHVHWAIKDLAMQGDPLAARTYFKCLSYEDYGSVLNESKLALEYAGEKGDSEAISMLIQNRNYLGIEILQLEQDYRSQGKQTIFMARENLI